MVGKIRTYLLTGAFLTVVLLLYSCVTPSSYYITGEKRTSVPYEGVTLYESPPARYEVVGYAGGWRDSSGPFISEDEAERDAIEELKKTAGEMGANGIIMFSLEDISIHMGGTEYGPIIYMVAAGWAVHVPDERDPSDVRGGDGSEREEGKFRIYIEPPGEYEVLAKVSSRHRTKNLDMHHILDTKSETIGKCLEDLKKEVKNLDGSGVYITDVRKESTTKIEYDEPRVVGGTWPFLQVKREVYLEEKMYYVFSGEVVRLID